MLRHQELDKSASAQRKNKPAAKETKAKKGPETNASQSSGLKRLSTTPEFGLSKKKKPQPAPDQKEPSGCLSCCAGELCVISPCSDLALAVGIDCAE